MTLSPTVLQLASVPTAPLRTVTVDMSKTPEEPPMEGVTFIRTGTFTVQYSRSAIEQEALDYRVSLYHRKTPMLAADAAINTIDQRLARLDKEIARSKPGLSAGWDVTIKDGKLEAVGTVTAQDKEWLNRRLNSDRVLVAAVASYTKAAVDYLETSDDNPPYTGVLKASGRRLTYNFTGVDKQMEGSVLFRSLSERSWREYTNERTGMRGDPGPYRGSVTLELLAGSLRPHQR